MQTHMHPMQANYQSMWVKTMRFHVVTFIFTFNRFLSIRFELKFLHWNLAGWKGVFISVWSLERNHSNSALDQNQSDSFAIVKTFRNDCAQIVKEKKSKESLILNKNQNK